eukprot:TRINITY_DN10775_c0_g1_i1.p1 TRINITY_DN10775_c0_g1~~TRINITY_DN10775_c0_g1_i1.p1  ORF type:complete len:466 (+),score=86.27 TRINITY_DN10775_c0_g1_i1:45-1442(+)
MSHEKQEELCCHGPGFLSPLEATKGPKEKLLYVPCVAISGQTGDYIATIDVDPNSTTYSQVLHRLQVNNLGDELHHTGWNACSSCHADSSKQRRYLIAPGLKSGNIYIIDTFDPKSPKIHKVVSGKEIAQTVNLSWPHTVHCLASGDLMISFMGDAEGNATGGFLLLDPDFKIKGRWDSTATPFGYDFWYQPRHNIMVSSEWGSPKAFSKGFDPSQLQLYGKSLHFWDWKERKLIKTVDLGEEGLVPLELRFLHNPDKAHGFVGAALSSNVFHFYKDGTDWKIEKVIDVPAKPVSGWALPHLPGLITDILISLDDKFLYFSNWLQGDIRQYDITNPSSPKLVGQLFLAGTVLKDGPVKYTSGDPAPDVPQIQGKAIRGGPQMIQLSLDGKRLYVTNSLFSEWDKQFYPTLSEKGSQLLLVDVDNEKGGLKLNQNFLVDFSTEPWGPALAHEVRYPGGDCSSDIWV